MNNRGGGITFITYVQIFLIVSVSFSLAFFLNADLVSGQDTPPSVSGDIEGDDTVPNLPSTQIPAANTPVDNTRILRNTYDENGNPIGGGFGQGGGGFGDPNLNEGEVNADKGGGIGDFIFGFFKGEMCGGVNGLGALCAGLVWGITLGGIAKFVADAFGADAALSDALFKSIFVGSVAGGLAANMVNAGWLGSGGQVEILGGDLGAQGFGTLIGIGVAVAVFLLTYKETEFDAVQFTCMPYEPPLGGSDCEKCNQDPFRPCSEYRCKSLGQACELVNPGTEAEACVWVSKSDVNPPTITPWDEPLTDGHSYVNHDILPPSLGTKIIRDGAENGCLQAFTPLEFGIITNEPAQCKIDWVHRDKYDEMQYYFGETNFYLYNHTQRLSLPGPDSLNAESPELQNDGQYNLYVRCQDANGNFRTVEDPNGNTNVQEFAFQFCVDPSPDTTPPTIVDTSITSGSPVTFEVQQAEIEVYVNEPAECKWSVQDKAYDEMENLMSCSTKAGEINARLLYTCSTTLNGIKDRSENKYYFRCKDQPSKPDNERNVNVQSYEFSLLGSQPLNIISVKPNETITDSTNVVSVDLEVETSNGADEGKAICYFSPTGSEGSYVQMFETDNFEHKQTLTLAEGNYNYYFRCVDAGGNSDEDQTAFNVEVDTEAPSVTRAYKDLDALKVVTDEEAECVYSLNSCNYVFEEGLPLIYSNSNFRQRHYVPWKANTVHYIKCRDDFNNQPNPNECSIIVTGTNSL